MVSGLVASPWDQDSISSGDARRSAMDSKSLMRVSAETCASGAVSRAAVFVVVMKVAIVGSGARPDALRREAAREGGRSGLRRTRWRGRAPPAPRPAGQAEAF